VIHGKEIPYGLFLGEVVNFLLIALALFIVKFLGWLMQTKHEEAATPLPPHAGASAPNGDSGSVKRGGVRRTKAKTTSRPITIRPEREHNALQVAWQQQTTLV